LAHIKTKYTLLMLDDFFLRSKVEQSKIEEIVRWMDEDKNIVCFNCDPNVCYTDWEVDRYPGFRRLPPGNNYTLSLQAAIWRTKGLKKYWRPNVTPWEWEEFCNVRTIRYPNDKFYCLNNADSAFFDYGHKKFGGIWGVYRGKWVIDDVAPLFEKENIYVDYSVRGMFHSDERRNAITTTDNRRERYGCIARCLGCCDVFMYFIFCRYCNLLRKKGKEVDYNYFRFMQRHAQRRFIQSQNR